MNEIARVDAMAGAYQLIASLWCSPQDVDPVESRKAAPSAIAALRGLDGESAGLLERFLDHEPVTEEAYIELFELSPLCALYLGSHAFEEPTTCSGAANCDRNKYMVEVINLYKHFGLALTRNELPDYLPLMVEFLALTARARHDPVRQKLIEEYLLPLLEPMCARLDELKTPYAYLGQALSALLHVDLERAANDEKDLAHG